MADQGPESAQSRQPIRLQHATDCRGIWPKSDISSRMAKRPRTIKFILAEEPGKFHALLILDDEVPSEFEDELTPVRIQYPLVTPEQLLELAKAWRETVPEHTRAKKALDDLDRER
jgi:hypothetical protein